MEWIKINEWTTSQTYVLSGHDANYWCLQQFPDDWTLWLPRKERKLRRNGDEYAIFPHHLSPEEAMIRADEIIAEREKNQMSEPWSKEQLERIKEVHDRESCETTKRVLRELAGPGAWEEEWNFEVGKLYRCISGKDAGHVVLCVKDNEADKVLYDIHDGLCYGLVDDVDERFSPINSGTVTLTVKDGKIQKAEVNEG